MKKIITLFLIVLYISVPIGIGYFFLYKDEKKESQKPTIVKRESTITTCYGKANEAYVEELKESCALEGKEENCSLSDSALTKANRNYLTLKQECEKSYR